VSVNGILSRSFPSVTFAVLNVDQTVEHGVEPC